MIAKYKRMKQMKDMILIKMEELKSQHNFEIPKTIQFIETEPSIIVKEYGDLTKINFNSNDSFRIQIGGIDEEFVDLISGLDKDEVVEHVFIGYENEEEIKEKKVRIQKRENIISTFGIEAYTYEFKNKEKALETFITCISKITTNNSNLRNLKIEKEKIDKEVKLILDEKQINVRVVEGRFNFVQGNDKIFDFEIILYNTPLSDKPYVLPANNLAETLCFVSAMLNK